MTTSDRSGAGAAHALFDGDEVREVLRDTFFRSEPVAPVVAAPRARRAKGPAKAVPKEQLPYEVICISMYTDDLANLDAMVDELKARGLTKANRSALIRHALANVDLSKVPKGL